MEMKKSDGKMKINSTSIFNGKVIEYLSSILSDKEIKKLKNDSYGDELISALRKKGVKPFVREDLRHGTDEYFNYMLKDNFYFIVYKQDGDYASSYTNKWNGKVLNERLEEYKTQEINIEECLINGLNLVKDKAVKITVENSAISFSEIHYKNLEFGTNIKDIMVLSESRKNKNEMPNVGFAVDSIFNVEIENYYGISIIINVILKDGAILHIKQE